ncbi:hypothetical protein V491_05425 [Pseudogymnoascus sp. VKM F-3775]|nr:hypothetical protein V491_05425 [Pseudogymnoascus sp. VKM F-3775]
MIADAVTADCRRHFELMTQRPTSDPDLTAYRRHLLVAAIAAVLVTLSIWIFYRQQLQSAGTLEQDRPEFQGFFNFATDAHCPHQPDFVELATDALFYDVHNLELRRAGQIRNSILNCVRYAIEAGGELVVPQSRLRNPNDLFDFKTETKVNLTYLFDLKARLQRDRAYAEYNSRPVSEAAVDIFHTIFRALAVPQLKLHSALENVPNTANALDPVNLTPEELENDSKMTSDDRSGATCAMALRFPRLAVHLG